MTNAKVALLGEAGLVSQSLVIYSSGGGCQG